MRKEGLRHPSGGGGGIRILAFQGRRDRCVLLGVPWLVITAWALAGNQDKGPESVSRASLDMKTPVLTPPYNHVMIEKMVRLWEFTKLAFMKTCVHPCLRVDSAPEKWAASSLRLRCSGLPQTSSLERHST